MPKYLNIPIQLSVIFYLLTRTTYCGKEWWGEYPYKEGIVGASQIVKIEMFCEAPSEIPALHKCGCHIFYDDLQYLYIWKQLLFSF